MGLDVSKISSDVARTASKVYNNAGNYIGNAIEKSSHKEGIDKFIKALEPTGANNPFCTMVALMLLAVIIPRVQTAMKRNPDDKEATKDEITEILFRDIQTVLIILFALKSINSVVANIATKKGGLPMVNKPLKPLFETNEKGLKGIAEKAKEFAKNPLDKLKTLGKNTLDVLHPTGGSRALTNDEFVSKYSNFASIKEVSKMLDEVQRSGGDKNKVFNKIIDGAINEQKILLEGNSKKGTIGLVQKLRMTQETDGSKIKHVEKEIENAKKIMSSLEEIKEKGVDSLLTTEDESVIDNILASLKDANSTLAFKGKTLSAYLRTGALAFEAMYLGFGLPALNQKRLEKKYLQHNGGYLPENTNYSNALISKNIKAHEVKLYQGFIK